MAMVIEKFQFYLYQCQLNAQQQHKMATDCIIIDKNKSSIELSFNLK